jgi:hypothetical protein
MMGRLALEFARRVFRKPRQEASAYANITDRRKRLPLFFATFEVKIPERKVHRARQSVHDLSQFHFNLFRGNVHLHDAEAANLPGARGFCLGRSAGPALPSCLQHGTQ